MSTRAPSDPRIEKDLGSAYLRFSTSGPVAWLAFDRPASRNALTAAMYRGVRRAISVVERSEVLHALVLTGVGDVFAPGGDLGEGDEDQQEPVEAPDDPANQPFEIMRRTSVPIVAAVNGHAHAGGLLLALLADVTVASDRSTFRAPEALRGFPELWLASTLTAHVGVALARDILMTGRRVDAAEALRMGLIARVVAHDDLRVEAQEAALQMLDAEPYARSLVKQAVNGYYVRVDEVTFARARRTEEAREGFRAFIERRPPSWSASLGRPWRK